MVSNDPHSFLCLLQRKSPKSQFWLIDTDARKTNQNEEQSQNPYSFPAITSEVAFFMHPGNARALNPRLKTSARGLVKQSWNT